MSAFLIPFEFLLKRTSSNMRGIEDLPVPLVPTNCVTILSVKSNSLSVP